MKKKIYFFMHLSKLIFASLVVFFRTKNRYNWTSFMIVCFLLSLIALKGLKHWRLKRLFEFHSELGFAVKSGFFT